MYKGNSASLQRKHRVIEVRQPTGGYIAEDDLVPHAEGLGLQDCISERAKLMLDKTRAENELIGAKAVKDERSITAIGLRIQSYCNRLSLITRRIKHLRHDCNEAAFKLAIKELVPPDLYQAVVKRQREIFDATQTTTLSKGRAE